jgi:hypothetical protein
VHVCSPTHVHRHTCTHTGVQDYACRVCTHTGVPNPTLVMLQGSEDGLVTLATGQELASLGQPWFKRRKKTHTHH